MGPDGIGLWGHTVNLVTLPSYCSEHRNTLKNFERNTAWILEPILLFFFLSCSSIMQIGPGESTLRRNFQQIQEREGRHTPNPLYQPPAPPRGAQPNQQHHQQQQRHHQQQHQQQQQHRDRHGRQYSNLLYPIGNKLSWYFYEHFVRARVGGTLTS